MPFERLITRFVRFASALAIILWFSICCRTGNGLLLSMWSPLLLRFYRNLTASPWGFLRSTKNSLSEIVGAGEGCQAHHPLSLSLPSLALENFLPGVFPGNLLKIPRKGSEKLVMDFQRVSPSPGWESFGNEIRPLLAKCRWWATVDNRILFNWPLWTRTRTEIITFLPFGRRWVTHPCRCMRVNVRVLLYALYVPGINNLLIRLPVFAFSMCRSDVCLARKLR